MLSVGANPGSLTHCSLSLIEAPPPLGGHGGPFLCVAIPISPHTPLLFVLSRLILTKGLMATLPTGRRRWEQRLPQGLCQQLLVETLLL